MRILPLLTFLMLLCGQIVNAQVMIYANEGLQVRKAGRFENNTIYTANSTLADAGIGTVKTEADGKTKLCAADGTAIGYIEWNTDPNGASTIYSINSIRLGFVSTSNGRPVLFTVKEGKARAIGFADTSGPASETASREAAAAAAFLLFFDWC